MTLPPRPKYPSDQKNYHDTRKPGFAHTIRLPEELLGVYVSLKHALGPRSSHADVIRFLFEAAETSIQAVIQANEAHVVRDNQHQSEDYAQGEVVEDSEHESEEEDVILQDSQVDIAPRETMSSSILKQLMAFGRKLKAFGAYVDCRFDSSRSGYHGTLPVINVEDDKIIEMVTLTRKEVGSSWKIETMALQEALCELLQAGLTIEEIAHDDNASVDAILSQHGIMSSKDLWHKCKIVMSKFKLKKRYRTSADLHPTLL
ncbi:hypothetical protein R1sor_006662 [Riccia sorocarpa]|uniref:RNase H type-1 domain-containing protein n=1 Tax=Riccia sorocarpa TaxID=122646 RepID=A0ABD3HSB9_9MARC